MNKIQIIIDSVFAAAIVALFVVFFTVKPTSRQSSGEVVVAEVSELPIAYLNLDSLLANYTFAQEAQERLMTKQEDARLTLNKRARTLQNEMADFQRKLENNAFLSRERAENEQKRLLKKQQELEDLEAKLTNDILEENQRLNMQMRDTLDNFLKEFNSDGRYQIIFANTQSDNVLLAQPGYDVTDEVVSALNQRYSQK